MQCCRTSNFSTQHFRNGGYLTSPLLGRFCGNRIPSTIPSFSNQLFLKFSSDNSLSARGFEVSWDGTATGTSKSIMFWDFFFTIRIPGWHVRSCPFTKAQLCIVESVLQWMMLRSVRPFTDCHIVFCCHIQSLIKVIMTWRLEIENEWHMRETLLYCKWILATMVLLITVQWELHLLNPIGCT